MEWAQRLKTYRRQMGYKQTAAAEALGVSQATLSKWERGLYEPTVAAKSKIYKAIAQDADELIVTRQRFFIQNSNDYHTLLRPGSTVLEAISASPAKRLALHPSMIEGFDAASIVPDGHMKLFEEIRRAALIRDKDVVRISCPIVVFDQAAGQWIETQYHLLPVHSGSGAFTHLTAAGAKFIDEPKSWKDEYTVHSVFGDETFRY